MSESLQRWAGLAYLHQREQDEFVNENDDGHKEREMSIGLTVLTDFRHLRDLVEGELRLMKKALWISHGGTLGNSEKCSVAQ